MSPYSIFPLISALLFCILGLSCYLKNRTSKANISFAILCLTTVWWQGCWTILFNIKNPSIASILVKIGYSGIIFIPITYYHFTIEFLDRKTEKKLVMVSYIMGIFFLVTLWTTDYFIKGYHTYHWGYYPKASLILHLPYLLMLSLQASRILFLLFGYLRSKQLMPTMRNQVKYMALATSFYTLASVDFLTNYGFKQYPLGFIPILISLSIISYAIARYRLMDVNIIIGKGLAYLSFLGLVCIIMSIMIFGINFIMPNLYDLKRILITLGLVSILYTVCIILYPRFLVKLETGIRELLYKDKYKYQDSLREVAGTIPTIYDMERLLRYTLDTTTSAFESGPASIMLIDEITKSYIVKYNIGLPEELSKRITFHPDTEIVQKLRWGDRILLKEEFPEDNPVRERIEAIRAEVCAPIVRKDKLLGIINLNHKGNGDIYSHEDLSLLSDISKYLGMAIENISLSKREHQEELITYLNNIAYALAHELKNKSQTIVSTAEIIQSMLPNVTNVPQELLDLAKIASEKSNEIDTLVNELIAYSNVQQREGYGETELDRLLDKCSVIIKGEMETKGLKLIKDYRESKISHGDWGQLLQVFISVIQNSIEAMDTGGILTLKVNDKADFWEVIITDTGKGIPDNLLGSIFEPFFTTKHDHKGLGLSIARRIVYDHAGEIKVESTEGKGTIIYIYLPKQMPDDKLKARAEIKRREDIAYDRIKTKDYQDKLKRGNG